MPNTPPPGTMFMVSFNNDKEMGAMSGFNSHAKDNFASTQGYAWKGFKARKVHNSGVTIHQEILYVPTGVSHNVRRTRVYLTSDIKAQLQLISYQGDWSVDAFQEIAIPRGHQASTSPPQRAQQSNREMQRRQAPMVETTETWCSEGGFGWLLENGNYENALNYNQVRSQWKQIQKKSYPEKGEVEKMKKSAYHMEQVCGFKWLQKTGKLNTQEWFLWYQCEAIKEVAKFLASPGELQREVPICSVDTTFGFKDFHCGMFSYQDLRFSDRPAIPFALYAFFSETKECLTDIFTSMAEAVPELQNMRVVVADFSETEHNALGVAFPKVTPKPTPAKHKCDELVHVQSDLHTFFFGSDYNKPSDSPRPVRRGPRGSDRPIIFLLADTSLIGLV